MLLTWPMSKPWLGGVFWSPGMAEPASLITASPVSLGLSRACLACCRTTCPMHVHISDCHSALCILMINGSQPSMSQLNGRKVGGPSQAKHARKQ